MIFEMAVADAYAIPFEFVKDPQFPNDLKTYHQHPKYDLKPSQYTDDTMRSMAVARWIIRGHIHDPVNFISHLQAEYGKDPSRQGWSRGFQKLLEENYRDYPQYFMDKIHFRKASNGSIMGVAPCGYLHSIPEVKTAAMMQAISTHSWETVPYAQALALAAHYFIHDLGAKEDVFEFTHEHVDGQHPSDHGIFLASIVGPVNMTAKDTSFAVMNLIYKNDKLSDILRKAVDLGGDTDSVAALAVGIGSCCKEIENDLPKELCRGLEFSHGPTQGWLKALDESLLKMKKDDDAYSA